MHHRLIQFFSCWALISVLGACSTKEPPRNRLGSASSPYLREHADNPVDWYEWGDEALDKAQREGKPIIVSIGYASCHWCHVMEEETFMDTAVARLMNEHFVSIKIDREERPDIDQIYLNAAQLISGNAGWPLNAFAMPDGKPFFAATYFPKKQWLGILSQVTEAFASEHEKLRKQADELTKGVQLQDQIHFADNNANISQIGYLDIYNAWLPSFDVTNGGLTGPLKFPMPVVWEFLLQHNYLTGDTSAMKRVVTTLGKMSQGGIYDHLAGGFARYTTDSLWRVPHFEKMLYDNSQLVSLYSKAYQVTRNPAYAKVVRETLLFIETKLTSPEGAFYSSLNADSEGEEGKFYVWTQGEIENVLEKKYAGLFADYYGVTATGNWELNKNILFVDQANDTIEKQLARSREALLNYRGARVHPTTDNKILTSWNALMISGYVDAYSAFQNEDFLEMAVTNATFLDQNRVDENGHVWRSKTGGHPPIEGFLDDYALLAKGYIQLYQVTFDIHWLNQARKIGDYAFGHFRDEQSGLFYYTLDKSAQAIARKIEITDQVIPSSNSVMAEVLYLLGEYYEEDRFTDAGKDMARRLSPTVAGMGPYYANWAKLMGMMWYEPYEVAIMGPDALAKRKQLLQNYLPTVIVMGGTDENLPLLENKRVEGRTIIYVCRNKVCKLPVEDVEKAMAQIK